MIMPLVIVLSWCAIAVTAAFNIYDGNTSIPQSDFNNDGLFTVSDAWFLFKSSWLAATLLPFLICLVLFEKIAPNVYRFLEVHSIYQHESILMFIGLMLWIAVCYYSVCAEIHIRDAIIKRREIKSQDRLS